jgi:uncharacterized repeat protein (TIGR03847 family)
MAGEVVDFKPISRITIGTVGPPGRRIFLLQASQGHSMITLKLEKEQAKILASSLLELLEQLNDAYPEPQPQGRPLSADLMLQEPMEPAFVVGQIGLGYDQNQDMLVLVVQEIQPEHGPDPMTVRFWVTRSQMQAMSEHTLEVVNQGRPLCPLCNGPMDPEGHFCPRGNGHEKRIVWE